MGGPVDSQPVEDGRRDVSLLDIGVDPIHPAAGGVTDHQEGPGQLFVAPRPYLAHDAVIAERLAVIRQDHDHGVVEHAHALDFIEEVAHPRIDKTDNRRIECQHLAQFFGVQIAVAVTRDGADIAHGPVGESRVYLSQIALRWIPRLVRAEVVDPQE